MDEGTARVAAASMAVFSAYAEDAIPILVDAREKAADVRKLDFDFALDGAYTKTENYPELLTVARRLYIADPTSVRAFDDLVNALVRLSKFDEAGQIAQERLKRMPEDLDAIRALARISLQSGHAAECRSWERKVVDLGKATTDDFNLEAWSALSTAR